MSTTLPDDSVSPFNSDEGDYDPFEAFNRSAGIGVVENPYPIFALVRAEHTMKREDFTDMIPESDDLELLNSLELDESIDVFTAYGFDAVQQVLKDGETFSSAGYSDIMGPVFGHSILEMDEPEHHTYRGLVQQAFSRKAMETWERELVRGVVDEMPRRDHRRQARRPRAHASRSRSP